MPYNSRKQTGESESHLLLDIFFVDFLQTVSELNLHRISSLDMSSSGYSFVEGASDLLDIGIFLDCSPLGMRECSIRFDFLQLELSCF